MASRLLLDDGVLKVIDRDGRLWVVGGDQIGAAYDGSVGWRACQSVARR